MGEYSLLGLEGYDNDGDGQVNEDTAGGYDMNRNWAFRLAAWLCSVRFARIPVFVARNAGLIRIYHCAPENIAALQTYHNAGGMILACPGTRRRHHAAGATSVCTKPWRNAAKKMLPFYRSMVVWKDLYTVWGGEFDWSYGALGIVSFSNELWSMRNLERGVAGPSPEDGVAFLKYVLHQRRRGESGIRSIIRPSGPSRFGGTRNNGAAPLPSFMLEEECHRNMAFTLYHADQMPLLRISEVKLEKIDDGLFRVWVEVENTRLIPTRTEQDVANHINTPDILSLQGNNVKVLSAGRVTDR
jgi:hypothetical protein